MSLTDRIKSKVERSKPRITECIIYARPLPLIADEKPPAGDDFRFKCVFDPTDRHLRQLETPERLELMKPFFAHGGCVILGRYRRDAPLFCRPDTDRRACGADG